jgi:hypothetical protein
MRMPPCSSPPRAGAQVGLCAVVMVLAADAQSRHLAESVLFC